MSESSEAAPIGRPSLYTPELADKICELLIDGQSLREICERSDIPSKTTVLRWTIEHPEFRDQYARARDLQGETDADDVGHIARKVERGEMDPSAARVAIDALKWSAGKRQPKKYGEAVQMKHSGAVGVFDPSKHSTEELNALLSILEPAAVAGEDDRSDQGGTASA